MFFGRRQRATCRNQFRLFVNFGDVLPVFSDTFHPMLFHPDYVEGPTTASTSSTTSEGPQSASAALKNAGDNATVKDSNKMFSATSPTRSMIKEANDHLALLHQRVVELEATVQEQAEALIKKDEQLQTKLRDQGDAKDAKIREFSRSLEVCEQRVRRAEQLCREKDMQIEALTSKCTSLEELATYVPVLERLVSSLKKLPRSSSSLSISRSGSKGRSSRNSSGRSNSSTTINASGPAGRHQPLPTSSSTTSVLDGPTSMMIDGHDKTPNQALADLRLSRSFSINQNFSMSEDEGDEFS